MSDEYDTCRYRMSRMVLSKLNEIYYNYPAIGIIYYHGIEILEN